MSKTDIIDSAEFRRNISRNPACGYLLFGEEDYLKPLSLKALRASVCPDEALAPFNDICLDWLGLTPEKLVDAIVSMPMMSERKLVEVTGVNFRELKATQLEAYIAVFSQIVEYDYNTVVLCVPSGGIDEGYLPKRPSPILKKLSEYLVPVRFEKSTPTVLARWALKHFIANGVKADAAVCTAIVDYCGNDMYCLASEIDKLSWYTLADGRETVNPDDIRRVSVADTGYDSFAFANAIMENRASEALDILAEMRRRRVEPTAAMSEIIRVFCDMLSARLMSDEGLPPQVIAQKLKIHEYRVKLCLRSGVGEKRLRSAVTACTEADAALKLSPQGFTALERLICSL